MTARVPAIPAACHGKEQVQLACCFTCDWINSVALFGSRPAASQSMAISHAALLHALTCRIIGGQRMPIGDKEKAFSAASPIGESTNIVPQMQLARGTHGR